MKSTPTKLTRQTHCGDHVFRRVTFQMPRINVRRRSGPVPSTLARASSNAQTRTSVAWQSFDRETGLWLLGQVTIGDDTLSENADFHIYKAIWNNDPDPWPSRRTSRSSNSGTVSPARRPAMRSGRRWSTVSFRRSSGDRTAPWASSRRSMVLASVLTSCAGVCLRRVLWRSRGVFCHGAHRTAVGCS